MSANPPKNDRWMPYRNVRFVLIKNIGYAKPSRGLILDWKKTKYQWEALVVWFDDEASSKCVKMDWLSPTRLIPVPVDPNWDGHDIA